MVHRQQQVTLTANQGQNTERSCLFDWRRRGQRRQSINAKALTWYLPSQLVEANGDVVYRQVEPNASLQVKSR